MSIIVAVLFAWLVIAFVIATQLGKWIRRNDEAAFRAYQKQLKEHHTCQIQ